MVVTNKLTGKSLFAIFAYVIISVFANFHLVVYIVMWGYARVRTRKIREIMWGVYSERQMFDLRTIQIRQSKPFS